MIKEIGPMKKHSMSKNKWQANPAFHVPLPENKKNIPIIISKLFTFYVMKKKPISKEIIISPLFYLLFPHNNL